MKNSRGTYCCNYVLYAVPPFMTNEEKIKILREIEKRIDKANEEFAKNIGEIFHEFTEAMTAARQGEENKALEQAKKEKL